MSYVNPQININTPKQDDVLKLTDLLTINGEIIKNHSTNYSYRIEIQDINGNVLRTLTPETVVNEDIYFNKDVIVDRQVFDNKIVITVKDFYNLVKQVKIKDMTDNGSLGEGKMFSGVVNRNDYYNILGLNVK